MIFLLWMNKTVQRSTEYSLRGHIRKQFIKVDGRKMVCTSITGWEQAKESTGKKSTNQFLKSNIDAIRNYLVFKQGKNKCEGERERERLKEKRELVVNLQRWVIFRVPSL